VVRWGGGGAEGWLRNASLRNGRYWDGVLGFGLR